VSTRSPTVHIQMLSSALRYERESGIWVITDKAKRLLGFGAKIPLIDGLKRVVEWRQGRR
jgi:hypothetical protein